MRKLLILTAAIGSLSALLAFDAGAMPFAGGGFQSDDLTLAREGCGRGFRFSERLGRCVPEERRGPPECPPGFRFSEGRGRCVPFERERVRPECPRGFHFSERIGRCVPF